MNLCVRPAPVPQPKVYALGWLGDGEDLCFGMVLLRVIKIRLLRFALRFLKAGSIGFFLRLGMG